MKDWFQNFVSALKPWISFGYGPAEFHRDRHTAFAILCGWFIDNSMHLSDCTWATCWPELRLCLWIAAAAVVKNWMTNNPPPSS